jgi:hypothetical protein
MLRGVRQAKTNFESDSGMVQNSRRQGRLVRANVSSLSVRYKSVEGELNKESKVQTGMCVGAII